MVVAVGKEELRGLMQMLQWKRLVGHDAGQKEMQPRVCVEELGFYGLVSRLVIAQETD